MRVTYPAGRNVILTTPQGEEYDAREEVISRPWDLYDLPYSNLKCLWRLSWGDYYPFGYFAVRAGSGTLTRVANTELSSSGITSWFGKPYVKLMTTGTTIGGFIDTGINIYTVIPAGKKIYLYVVFTPLGGENGDSVAFDIIHWTGGREYDAGVIWYQGTGWSAKKDGGYQPIPDTPTTWYSMFYYPMLFSIVAATRLDKLRVMTYEYDLSDRTLYGYAGTGELLMVFFRCYSATGTPVGLALHEAALFVEK